MTSPQRKPVKAARRGFGTFDTATPPVAPPLPGDGAHPVSAAPVADTEPAPTSGPAPVPATAAVTGLPAVSEPASKADSKLADLLAGTGEPGTTAAGGGEEPMVSLRSLLTRPPVDPDLQLVGTGWRVPSYMYETIRQLAHERRCKQQDIVIMLLRHGLEHGATTMLAEARHAATGDRR